MITSVAWYLVLKKFTHGNPVLPFGIWHENVKPKSLILLAGEFLSGELIVIKCAKLIKIYSYTSQSSKWDELTLLAFQI